MTQWLLFLIHCLLHFLSKLTFFVLTGKDCRRRYLNLKPSDVHDGSLDDSELALPLSRDDHDLMDTELAGVSKTVSPSMPDALVMDCAVASDDRQIAQPQMLKCSSIRSETKLPRENVVTEEQVEVRTA